jgi:hypothetical protein
MNYSAAAGGRRSQNQRRAINMFGSMCIAPYSSNRARVDLQIVLGSGTKKIKNPLSNSTEIIAAAPQE